MKILELLTPKRKIGNIGEAAAARYLKRHGYRILKRNFVAAGHEIDIIAHTPDRMTLVFVEVKTRTVGKCHPAEPRPASAVTPEKQRGILSAARSFRCGFRSFAKMRFDITEVFLTDESKPKVSDIRHLVGAFDVRSAYTHRRG